LRLVRPDPLVKLAFAIGLVLLVLAACVPVLDPQSAIETGVAQTQQVSGLETAAAQAQGGGQTQTPVPPTAAPTLAAIDPSTFGADAGELVEQNGLWYWNGTQVVFTQHAESDGSLSVWMSLPDETDWPLFIMSSEGVWRLGIEEWNGAITIVNTTELTVDLSLAGGPRVAEGEAFTGSAEAQEQQFTPYEIFNFSSLPPGDYDFTFTYGTAQYACTLHFEQNSKYHVIIVPEGIALLDENSPPQTAAEVNILNSPLCID